MMDDLAAQAASEWYEKWWLEHPVPGEVFAVNSLKDMALWEQRPNEWLAHLSVTGQEPIHLQLRWIGWNFTLALLEDFDLAQCEVCCRSRSSEL